jgi:alanyl-tRNA synthetase
MPSRKLSGSEVRRMFLDYFVSKGHKEVHSSSLVPANDPTLLFTNAGMNQFKDVFLGIEKRDYNRATSSQKCVRAGGKHNDLENVGFTNRHHTFFEMLGNFSFGDYFKKDAIAYAWELVTSLEWFGIEKDKLYVTIFKGEQGIARDDEAYEHWRATLEKDGVPLDRIYEMGMKDNFWQMGDTGPCGPCSELHYDMGVAASDAGHTDCEFGCECGRYVEIWNLVFMQFDRQPDGEMRPLPKPSIDTGAGLERVTAVMQDVISNYETDLFTPIIEYAQGALVHRNPGKTIIVDPKMPSLRVIADHSRAFTFLISDGVLPNNEGRGYVLRKIIRRAIRHGRLMGAENPWLFEMVGEVARLMRDAYPELTENEGRITDVVRHEEIRFANTVALGLNRLDKDIAELVLDAVTADNVQRFAGKSGVDSLEDQTRERLVEATRAHTTRSLAGNDASSDSERLHDLLRLLEQRGITLTYPGDKAFKLYDTFGLPPDLIAESLRDLRIAFDPAGFDAAMAEQRKRAQASWKGGSKQSASPAYQAIRDRFTTAPASGAVGTGLMVRPIYSEFVGYQTTLVTGSSVLAIVRENLGVESLKPGEQGEVVLSRTPFYAEAGGQVGDVGWLYGEDHNTVVAEVTGSYYPVQGIRAHRVVAKQQIRVNDKVDAMVNDEVRHATMRNHTGTHLLHAALRNVLGTHVKQAGSLVDPGHLRFDFSHFASLDDEELQDIEDLANREVLRNDRVEVIEDVPIDVAVNEYHAMALFGEKYGDRVRVIRIGDFSTELCGGTHTAATGEIGLIKILKEGSVSSGVRRLEAVTGEGSLRHFRKDHQLENVVATLVRGGDDQSPAEALKHELERREDELKKLRKELEQARMKSASSSVSSATENVREVRGVKVLATRADNLERTQLRTLVDNLRNKLGSGVVVMGSVSDGRVALIVGVTKDLTSRVQAGKIIAEVAKKVGGSGGGRPDMAEAGGKDPVALDAALAESYGVVEGLLA